MIGVASTAPGYSLAASLGFVVAVQGIGLQAPAIMLLAFVPMLLIASAYYYMNRADPDCGTTFSWVTRAMGPRLGWLGGWAIVVADVIVMANLAQIAGLYSFLLVGWQSAADSTTAVTIVGVVWIAIMTAICVIGIELSARTQVGLLGAEILTLVVFAVVALVAVATGNAGEHAVDPSLSWINPLQIDSFSAMVSGVLIAVFIYWGWDSTVTVNEESRDANEGPGKAALLATVILLAIYVIVSVAAQAYDGTQVLIDNQDDVLSVLGQEVFGSPLDKILIIAVLTSAAASTQTTILPTARTSLSMARAGAMPASLGAVHPRFLTPHVSTILMGVLSIVWYVGLTIVSENILFDSIAALGLMIAFYYGLTGFACTIYYRRQLLRSLKSFLLIGVGPTLGGLMLTGIFVKSCYRPLQARELRVRRLLARARAAAGDRRRLPDPRRRADVRVGRAAPGVLPAQARGRRRAGRGDGLMAGEIVVGFDGRDGARAALEEAARLAQGLGAGLVVTFASAVSPLGGEVKDLHDAVAEHGRAVLEEALADLRGRGVEARAELVDEDPAPGMVDARRAARRADDRRRLGRRGPAQGRAPRLDAAQADPAQPRAGPGRAELAPGMDVEEAIRSRRTHKAYGPEPVGRDTLDELFELARWAPNHHLTNPWRFRVLGPGRSSGSRPPPTRSTPARARSSTARRRSSPSR